MSASPEPSCWSSPEHALEYLRRADSIAHRTEGEAALLEFVPPETKRALDLGSGAGRLLRIVQSAIPNAHWVALDFSSTMIAQLRDGFRDDNRVQIVSHDLENSLPALGSFDLVVSSFAIHHLPHIRKRRLYDEIFDLLTPGGVFCNLEHVASPNQDLHLRFLAKLGLTPEQEDSANKLLDLETQLQWLREIGFTDVDCHWKWRELALLGGGKPKP